MRVLTGDCLLETKIDVCIAKSKLSETEDLEGYASTLQSIKFDNFPDFSSSLQMRKSLI